MEAVLARYTRLSLDAYTLKVIAIVTMVIDHVGALFYPEVMIFRIIGRLTAPIFAFFIAEGYHKTRNVKKYMQRIGIFAMISAIPYHLVFHHSYFNILFDFLIGLIVIYLSDRVKPEWLKWSIVTVGAVTAFLIQTDGMLGISVLVYLFHRFRSRPKAILVSMSALYLFSVLMLICNELLSQHPDLHSFKIWIRPLSLMSLVFLFSYNGQRGKNMKHFFYWFYPGHLMMLYLIHLIISS